MESIIQKTLKILLEKLAVEFDFISVTDEDGNYRANIETPHAGRLIGRHGEILQALQILLKKILFAKNKEKIFVTIDVDGYQKNFDEKLIQRVEKRIAEMTEKNLREISLLPMGPYERRIVHLHITKNFPNFLTESFGEKNSRSIKISRK